MEFDGSGSASINGSTTFWNFKIDAISNKTITWDNTATFTFVNDVTIQTTVTNLITMVSDATGLDYSWDVQGTHTVVRVDARNCDASAGEQVRALNSDDSLPGSNTNWVFVTTILEGIELVTESTVIFPPVLFGIEIIADETAVPIIPVEGRRELGRRRSQIVLNVAK